MRRYAVVVTAAVEAALLEQVRVIAIDEGMPKTASRWLARMRQAVSTLHRLPRRAALAEEDRHVAYEVRRLVVGQHLILFTIDEVNERVIVVGLRHGRQLPVVDDLPAAEDLFEE